MKSLTRSSRLVGGIIIALIVAVTANNVSAQKAAKRAITKIAGDLVDLLRVIARLGSKRSDYPG